MAKETITIETAVNGKDLLEAIKKPRKSPVPASADRIAEGAKNLPLEERVKLRNALTVWIDEELKDMEVKFNKAKELVK